MYERFNSIQILLFSLIEHKDIDPAVKREANFFAYISRLMREKKVGLTETVSSMNLKELENLESRDDVERRVLNYLEQKQQQSMVENSMVHQNDHLAAREESNSEVINSSSIASNDIMKNSQADISEEVEDSVRTSSLQNKISKNDLKSDLAKFKRSKSCTALHEKKDFVNAIPKSLSLNAVSSDLESKVINFNSISDGKQVTNSVTVYENNEDISTSVEISLAEIVISSDVKSNSTNFYKRSKSCTELQAKTTFPADLPRSLSLDAVSSTLENKIINFDDDISDGEQALNSVTFDENKTTTEVPRSNCGSSKFKIRFRRFKRSLAKFFCWSKNP